jgi:hypothetical protein
MKHDQEKIQLDLLSAQWIFGVGRVLTFGAKKYAAHNWRRGAALSRYLAACLRHVFAFLGGEDNDPETGLSHLYHASCCLMFASELHQSRPDLDDRYKPEPRAATEERLHEGVASRKCPYDNAMCAACPDGCDFR